MAESAFNIGDIQGQIKGLSDQIGSKVDTSAIANNLTTTAAGYVLDARQGKTLAGKFSTLETHKVTRVGTYFTEKDAWHANRYGNTIVIVGYIQITTQVPASTAFANIGFSTANGKFLFIQGDGTQGRVCNCENGVLKPDTAMPTGYYHAIGCAIMAI